VVVTRAGESYVEIRRNKPLVDSFTSTLSSTGPDVGHHDHHDERRQLGRDGGHPE
jgi:hypothetical protein